MGCGKGPVKAVDLGNGVSILGNVGGFENHGLKDFA